MKKIFSMMLLVASVFAVSCGGDDDGGAFGSYDVYSTNGTYDAEGEMAISIVNDDKSATVTMTAVSFHDDMTPIDIVIPEVEYDDLVEGEYFYYSSSIIPQKADGTKYDDEYKLSNVEVMVWGGYYSVYFSCDVNGETVWFTFDNYPDDF